MSRLRDCWEFLHQVKRLCDTDAERCLAQLKLYSVSACDSQSKIERGREATNEWSNFKTIQRKILNNGTKLYVISKLSTFRRRLYYWCSIVSIAMLYSLKVLLLSPFPHMFSAAFTDKISPLASLEEKHCPFCRWEHVEMVTIAKPCGCTAYNVHNGASVIKMPSQCWILISQLAIEFYLNSVASISILAHCV